MMTPSTTWNVGGDDRPTSAAMMSASMAGPTNGLVYLVRHGRTALNADGRLRGHLDPPLDEVGLAEVADLAHAFASLVERPCRVVAGPLARTRQTAQAIADLCGLSIEVEPRLIDRDYGPWTGEVTARLTARFGEALEELPEAESIEEVAARGREVLDEQRALLRHGPVVLVAHDAVNRLLLAELDGETGSSIDGAPRRLVPQRTAAWNAIEPVSSGWRVLVENGGAAALRVFGSEEH